MTNLEKFRFYLQDIESPDHFLDWNFYFMIASCLGRRIWFNDDWPLHPNMFLTFVGDPGVGKSVPAVKVKSILKSLIKVEKNEGGTKVTNLVKMSPDSMSLQALWQSVADATEYVKISDNPKKFYVHSSVCFLIADELGTLFNEDSKDLIPFLTQAWDCGDFHRKTKTQGEVYLKNMCVNLLGCATPSWVKRNVREQILEEGYGARTIWIWGAKPRQRTTIIKTSPEQISALEEVKLHLRVLCSLPPSKLTLTPEALEWFDNWTKTRRDLKANNDKKLLFYYARKNVHLIKLAMALHFSDKTTLTLDLEDFIGALKILEREELSMHLCLSSGGKNPLHELAEKLLKSIGILNGEATSKRLLLEHYDEGDAEQIAKALEFLTNTGQVNTHNNKEGKTIYAISKN